MAAASPPCGTGHPSLWTYQTASQTLTSCSAWSPTKRPASKPSWAMRFSRPVTCCRWADVSERALGISGLVGSLAADGHAEIRCCHPPDDLLGGVAFPWFRLIVLDAEPAHARHVFMHELYHLLGFADRGEATGVRMSDSLVGGIPKTSTALDLAKLACIFD